MNIRKRMALRWTFLVGYIGFLSLLTGCAALAVGSSSLQQGLLQLDGDVVEVQGQNGDWRPVAGQSTFELVGNIESMDPWIVGSRSLQTSETTQIGEGLQLNELCASGERSWRTMSGWLIPLNVCRSRPIL